MNRKASLWEQFQTECPTLDLMYAEWLENKMTITRRQLEIAMEALERVKTSNLCHIGLKDFIRENQDRLKEQQ